MSFEENPSRWCSTLSPPPPGSCCWGARAGGGRGGGTGAWEGLCCGKRAGAKTVLAGQPRLSAHLPVGRPRLFPGSGRQGPRLCSFYSRPLGLGLESQDGLEAQRDCWRPIPQLMFQAAGSGGKTRAQRGALLLKAPPDVPQPFARVLAA